MNQCGRLQRLARLLLGHSRGRQLAQLVVDQWQQLSRSVWVASLNGGQNLGDIGHAAEPTHWEAKPQTLHITADSAEHFERRPGS